MGKTTLFSRVALSPNATKGADKKDSALSAIQKPNATASDYDTNASTQVGAGQAAMGKTVRSSTTTSTFKEAI